MSGRYLIDSDVFIQAKNLHYRFEFCSGYWDWIRAGFERHMLYSVRKVRAELLEGDKDDPVRAWVENVPDGFFLDDVLNPDVMTCYAQAIATVNASTVYTQGAKEQFAESKRADAFLVAAAMHYGFDIVTHEVWDPNTKKRVPIPNIASAMGVRTLTVFQLLKKHAVSTFLWP